MTPFGPTDGVRNACMRHGNCRIPGGSSANVIKGLANLAPHRVTATFLGMVGRDATGREYRQRLEEQGVVPVLLVGSRISLSVCLDPPSSPFLLVYPTPPASYSTISTHPLLGDRERLALGLFPVPRDTRWPAYHAHLPRGIPGAAVSLPGRAGASWQGEMQSIPGVVSPNWLLHRGACSIRGVESPRWPLHTIHLMCRYPLTGAPG